MRAENRGHPHSKLRFPAALLMGGNLLTPGHLGVRARNVHRKSAPKVCVIRVAMPQKCVVEKRW